MALGLRDVAVLLCCAAMCLLSLQSEGDLHIEPAWFQPIEMAHTDSAHSRGAHAHEIMHTYANGIAPLESELVSDTQTHTAKRRAVSRSLPTRCQPLTLPTL